MKKKKKFSMVYVYIGIVIILFGAIFVLGNLEKDNTLYGKPASDLNPATRAQLDDPNYQNIILPKELDKKVKDKEDFFVYMFASTCGYCKETTPQIMPIVNELSIDLPMFNLEEFRTYGTKYGVEFTPTLLYFKDGIIADKLEGGVKSAGLTQGNTLEDFKTFFVKNSGTEVK